MQLEEQKKIQCQKDEKLQTSIKELSDCRDEILRLTKEVETQREKNVSLQNDQLGEQITTVRVYDRQLQNCKTGWRTRLRP